MAILHLLKRSRPYEIPIGDGLTPLIASNVTAKQPQNGCGRLNSTPASYGVLSVPAISLARSGDHVGAVRRVKPLAEKAVNAPGTLYSVACVHALASVAAAKDASLGEAQRGETGKRYVDQAIDALNRAVACGFRDFARMHNDPDLAIVRNDPRYAELSDKVRSLVP